ncbi:ferredoxin [Gordonibacter sp. 28C]|uniref:DUF362 domain-containing protein n=1 Tax=Gordonibacter sp. 28C TaxID=2078569 RepID=UPI000DF7412D|nr:DUF362 domain-containing protein [Gordonibacter sp. 28C]RDB64318.1 ferredoxin [Gordonibacter sp. 28C]
MDNLIDRRTFILGAAAAGIATLAGCSTTDDELDGSEDAPSEPNPPDAAEQDEAVLDEQAAQEPPRVYLTRSIDPDGLSRAFGALETSLEGPVAVKVSTGEAGSNYLRAELIGSFVQSLDGVITECNTAYAGPRGDTESHLQLAADHGFTSFADVDIMDANGSLSLPVRNGVRLQENLVGANLANYRSMMVLSHFKGHHMDGFGGALKNMSVGIASAAGKCLIHSAGVSDSDRLLDETPQDSFLEALAESALSVADYFEGRIVYVNVMNRLSVGCDCQSYPPEPAMADVGILASLDPVALDRACTDLVYAAEDGQALVERMESRHASYALDHAEAIGVGSQAYTLIDID